MHLSRVFLPFFAALCLTAGSMSAFAETPSGMVVSVRPGAWVERNGAKEPLNVKDDIFVSDTLITDKTGRAQILFADDTTISLGADTIVAVADFGFGEGVAKPTFSARMTGGVARFVTGRVVEQNRQGFSVATPQATVGIRGTTFSVGVSEDGVTSVVALAMTEGLPIAVQNVKTGAVATISEAGMAVDASSSGNSSYEASPGQLQKSGSNVRGGSTSVAAAGDASTDGATMTIASVVQGVDLQAIGANSLTPDSGLSPSDILADLGVNQAPQSGTYAGTMTFTSGGGGGAQNWGSFSFDVDLASAAISNGTASMVDPNQGNTGFFHNGAGTIGGGGTFSANFSADTAPTWAVGSGDPNGFGGWNVSWSNKNNVSLGLNGAVGNGSTVSGDWTVINSAAGGTGQWYGTGAGDTTSFQGHKQ